MEVNLAEDVFPISEAQDSLRRVVKKASDTGRPMVITQNGRPVVAILGIGEFERLRRLASLGEEYGEIIEAQAGAWHSHEAVWGEIGMRLREAGGQREVEAVGEANGEAEGTGGPVNDAVGVMAGGGADERTAAAS